MKKIVYTMIVLIFLITLIGCQEKKNEDQIQPSFSGIIERDYVIGDLKPDFMSGIVASDETDGDLTDQIEVDESLVIWNSAGRYPVTYSVKDKAGNEKEVITYVNVVIESTLDELTVYYINDTHGAIEESGYQLGLSNIASLVTDEKSINPDSTLFIGGGDLLQGNILSNYYYGSSMIDIFNTMQMDVFVLGNHEFDWGLDMVTRYFNPNSEQVQADFPLLGANIFLKDTLERPEFVDAYTVIQKGSLKIGIIGLMGYGLEGSIATAKISPYVFDDPIYWAGYYAEHLRTVENVDIVLTVIHGNSDTTNYAIANLEGNRRVDALFNAHTHERYTQTIIRNGVDAPVLQSKASGEFVGRLKLQIGRTGDVIGFNLANVHPPH